MSLDLVCNLAEREAGSGLITHRGHVTHQAYAARSYEAHKIFNYRLSSSLSVVNIDVDNERIQSRFMFEKYIFISEKYI